jgi:hypothetical protein
MLHAVGYAVSHRPDGLETLLSLEPMDQKIWRRVVPGEGNVLLLLMLPGQPVNGKIRSTKANAVDLPMESALQGVTGLVEHKLDAGRAGIEDQNEWISRIPELLTYPPLSMSGLT